MARVNAIGTEYAESDIDDIVSPVSSSGGLGITANDIVTHTQRPSNSFTQDDNR